MMTAPLWYVEHYEQYDTHNGGFSNISEPFTTEAQARQFAEQVEEDVVCLYRCAENRFEQADQYHFQETNYSPQGWRSSFTAGQLAKHAERVERRRAESAINWDITLRQMARTPLPEARTYVTGGYVLTASDMEKIAAYRAEWLAEQAGQS